MKIKDIKTFKKNFWYKRSKSNLIYIKLKFKIIFFY